MDDEVIIEALERQKPKLVQTIELGGDYYYRCPWLSCNAEVTHYDCYCRKCGQRLEFPVRL